MSILAPLFVAVVLLLLQGPILQFAVSFTGGHAPAYGRALGTAVFAGIVSTLAAAAWGCTFGLLISFFSAWLAWAASALVAANMAALVYKGRLRLPFSQALVVAIVHNLLSSALAAAAWYLYRLF